jgi:hypothetical protein
MIKDVNLQLQIHHIYTIRNINNYSIEEFKTILIYVSWDSIFDHNGIKNVGIMFNSFLNNFLRIFCTSLPPRKIIERSNNNSWITAGIRFSCRRKRCLYLLTTDSDGVILKKLLQTVLQYFKKCIKEKKRICIIIELLTVPIK